MGRGGQYKSKIGGGGGGGSAKLKWVGGGSEIFSSLPPSPPFKWNSPDRTFVLDILLIENNILLLVAIHRR